jgi:hypothetical protein
MKPKHTKVICPSCRGDMVRRSHMSGFVERGILRGLGVRAFRCEACDERFYGYGHHSEGMEDAAGGIRKR